MDPNNIPPKIERIDPVRLRSEVENGLKDIYSSKIEKDTGIKLDSRNWEDVKAHLNKEALDNPEKLKDLAQKVREFRELPKQIERQIKYIYSGGGEAKLKELEQALLRVGKTNEDTGFLIRKMWSLNPYDVGDVKWPGLNWPARSEIKKEKNETSFGQTIRYGKYVGRILTRSVDAGIALGRITNFGLRTAVKGLQAAATETKNVLKKVPIAKDYFPTAEQDKDRALLKKLGINPDNADMELELKKVREEIRKTAEAKIERQQMEERLEALRAELFDESLAPTIIIAKITREKINQQFRDALAKERGPAGSIDKLLELRRKADKVISAGQTGIDYNKDRGIDTISSELDSILQISAKREFIRAIRNMASLNELEKTLRPFMESGEKTRNFLVRGIKKLIEDSVGKTYQPEEMARIDLLKLFIAKLENEELETELKDSSWLETTRDKIAKNFS